MSWLLVVILVIAVVFFVWQLALFIRDLIKHLKAKKMKKMVDNPSDKVDGRKE